jgi:hypothetical protein
MSADAFLCRAVVLIELYTFVAQLITELFRSPVLDFVPLRYRFPATDDGQRTEQQQSASHLKMAAALEKKKPKEEKKKSSGRKNRVRPFC